MAQVDFSNAVLDVYNDKPLTYGSYLQLNNSGAPYFHNLAGNYISVPTKSIILNTPQNVSILFTGVFNSAGTEFYIGDSAKEWKVSNISFSSGDTYSFVIDIEVSGNT